MSHKIFFALEARVNSCGISTTEVAFIFTLKQDKDHTMIVYENNLPARASVCFLVNTEYYDEAIDVRNNFFSSDNINKREMLMSNSVEFDKTYIEKYFRVNHDDFILWKLSISEI